MSQKPSVYAELLADRMEKHNTRCVLLNTGWTGGAYGTGNRMSLKATRALLDAALNGDLDGVDVVEEPTLGLKMPVSCPNVDDGILNPRNTSVKPVNPRHQSSGRWLGGRGRPGTALRSRRAGTATR